MKKIILSLALLTTSSMAFATGGIVCVAEKTELFTEEGFDAKSGDDQIISLTIKDSDLTKDLMNNKAVKFEKQSGEVNMANIDTPTYMATKKDGTMIVLTQHIDSKEATLLIRDKEGKIYSKVISCAGDEG